MPARSAKQTEDDMGAHIAEVLYIVADFRHGRCTIERAAAALERLARRFSGSDD